METGLRPRTSEHLDQILDPPLKLITNVSLAQFSCGRRDSTQMPLRTKNESFPLFSCDVQHQWQKCKIFRSIVLLQSPLKNTKKKKKKKNQKEIPPPPTFHVSGCPPGVVPGLTSNSLFSIFDVVVVFTGQTCVKWTQLLFLVVHQFSSRQTLPLSTAAVMLMERGSISGLPEQLTVSFTHACTRATIPRLDNTNKGNVNAM